MERAAAILGLEDYLTAQDQRRFPAVNVDGWRSVVPSCVNPAYFCSTNSLSNLDAGLRNRDAFRICGSSSSIRNDDRFT